MKVFDIIPRCINYEFLFYRKPEKVKLTFRRYFNIISFVFNDKSNDPERTIKK